MPHQVARWSKFCHTLKRPSTNKQFLPKFVALLRERVRLRGILTATPARERSPSFSAPAVPLAARGIHFTRLGFRIAVIRQRRHFSSNCGRVLDHIRKMETRIFGTMASNAGYLTFPIRHHSSADLSAPVLRKWRPLPMGFASVP